MSLPRMSFHIGDYRKDTGHLRAAGHGAYLLLIMHYWATGGLPNDDKQLAAIACMSDREWKAIKPLIQPLFKAAWKHKRIDEELAMAEALYQSRSTAGRSGNAVRWRSQSDRKAIANGSPGDRKAIPRRSQPITDNREPKDVDVVEGAVAGSLISREAWAIAEEIAALAGYPDPLGWPPGWCGAPLTAQKWLNEKWPREVIIAACREAIGRKRDGAPNSLNYFEMAVATAVARHARPLPTVVMSTPEVIHAQANQPAPNSFAASKDRWRAAAAALDASIADAERTADQGGEGGEPVG